MAILVLMGAIMASCSSDDNTVEEPKQPTNKDNVVTLTTTVGLGEGTTRAVAENGVKTFSVGDRIDVVYVNTSSQSVRATSNPLTADDISANGKSADFTVTLTNPDYSSTVRYYYPAGRVDDSGNHLDYSWLDEQDGSLAGLSSNEDFSYTTSHSWNGNQLPSLTLTNYPTIAKFTIKNGGSDITSTITSMTIKVGDNYTYTITPSSLDNIWVAMRPFSNKNIEITATAGAYVYEKSVTDQTLAGGNLTPINLTVTKVEGLLSGKFTINESGDQVRFSKGNLQATTTDLGAHWSWGFAEHQWAYAGNGVANNSINGNGTVSANGTVDLFGWSSAATYYGINNSTKDSDYSGDFVDWGNAVGSGWRTLTSDEWVWLLGPGMGAANPGTNCRTSSTVNGVANARYVRATVNYRQGVIVFPDSYTHPDDVTVPKDINTNEGQFATNTYDTTAWGKMESAGAVFLPGEGERMGNSVSNYNWACFYRSSTPNIVYIVESGMVSRIGQELYRGESVRLIRDVN